MSQELRRRLYSTVGDSRPLYNDPKNRLALSPSAGTRHGTLAATPPSHAPRRSEDNSFLRSSMLDVDPVSSGIMPRSPAKLRVPNKNAPRSPLRAARTLKPQR
ncbi:hypothetical protein KIPB_014113 [Kipferlia bialata]|uniref:Uncharacterized protein n=1 Tax=Kipferlia bialata TaxID=797122 RepID=A0A9K3GPC6_9EUKA|nr:hypothetical protein KIPB_014113 [Kipferlia bialata]|eukprot:g14113.t1